MSRESVEANMDTTHTAWDLWGISVDSGRDATVESLYELHPRLRGWGKYRLATAGAVIGCGFGLLATGKAPHYTLVIGRPLDDETWNLLLGVFSEPVPAPEW